MKKCISVKWMHCKSCEILLESKLSEIPWVTQVIADSKKKEVILEINENFQEHQLYKEIDSLGYGVHNKNEKNTILDYLLFWIVFLFIYLIGLVFWENLTFTSFLPWNTQNLVGIFFLWILASLSSCLAVTGWVIIWLSQSMDRQDSLWNIFKLHAWFHIGRLLAYFLWWGILGYFGSQIEQIMIINKILLVVSGWVMILLWLQMMKVIPDILSFHMLPKSLSQKILKNHSQSFSFFVGAATFILPCGFTQSVQILSIGSGSFWEWAKLLGIFALGTLPVLLAIGLGFSYIKRFSLSIFQKIMWVIVVSFGIYILAGFAQLIHFWNNSLDISPTSNQETLIEKKVIPVEHNGTQLVPQKVILSGANNYEVNILPTQDGFWCLFDMTIPWLDENVYKIKKWKNIQIFVNGQKKWTYKVVCTSMGMLHWSIEVK